jgi:peptidyl-prolyl cis-trans isomerase D
LDLGDDRYVVVKLNEYIPARQKTLAEVKADVMGSLRDEVARSGLAQRGAALLARINDGEQIEAVAKSEDLDWQVVMDAKRSTPGVNNEVKRFVFQLPATARDDLIESFYTRSGDFVVVALTDVESGDSKKLGKQERASLVYAGITSTSSRELQAVQAALLSNADIER